MKTYKKCLNALITRRSKVRVLPPQPKRSKSFRDLLFFIFPQKVPFGEILGKKSSQTVDITNKTSVKDYGKPKILFSSLLLFYREKFNDFSEKRFLLTSR